MWSHSHHSSAETSLFHNPNLHYLIHHYYVTSNSSYKCFHCFHHLIQMKIIISFKAAVELDRFTIDACPSSMIWDALKVIPQCMFIPLIVSFFPRCLYIIIAMLAYVHVSISCQLIGRKSNPIFSSVKLSYRRHSSLNTMSR